MPTKWQMKPYIRATRLSYCWSCCKQYFSTHLVVGSDGRKVCRGCLRGEKRVL